MHDQPLHEVIDLVDPMSHFLPTTTLEAARRAVATGDPAAVAALEGDFALVARQGRRVHMARSLSRPLRYFLAKGKDGPVLVVADRIDRIATELERRGFSAQFHPSYTRMVPAHHVLTLDLVGCPDPNPTCVRFFTPPRGVFPADVEALGRRYVEAAAREIDTWLDAIEPAEPIGVAFSGGVDSGAVLLLLDHLLCARGQAPQRLKAFTLSVDGAGEDLEQARAFLSSLSLSHYHEPLEVPARDLAPRDAVALVEDYKPLDVQSATMSLALARAVRARYPEWLWLVDGDGGDENFKDYPLEEGAEVTIKSVLSNPLLYHEGWGVDAVKHSLTYSGGLSRGVTRGYAPLAALGFRGFSPFMRKSVVAAAEGIPFVELTDWDVERLYRLKGDIVSAGIAALTGRRMPVFAKRRFQDGAMSASAAAHRSSLLPTDEKTYRDLFRAVHG